MATAGYTGLVIAFIAAIVSIIAFAAGRFIGRGERTARASEKASVRASADRLTRVGRAGVVLTTVALLFCCGVLVWCFMTGDVSIKYVLEERSLSTSSLAWLYKLSGLWAGRAGSLLFWVFLIAAFNFVIVLASRGRNRAGEAALDNIALSVSQIVVLIFLAVLLFSSSNMPFTPTPSNYFNSDGTLTAAASLQSMNQLLEHWAMAIHPPTLFIGYAGMTVPFAYAVATLILNDSSKLWVLRSQRYVLFSWLFLGAGIGLGAVWAYVVLGWGGYWGWDPVENASLLSWLVGVALLHTFTVYRQRGAFKRWGIMCAGLAFTFVIVATFITRSGVVQSVHAFEGDPVSLVLFGALIVVSLLVVVIGLIIRWKSFASDVEGGDDVENFASKDAAYYFNNVIMIMFTIILTYMTVASALPSWMPFGGESLSTTSYEALAHPLGIVYLAILAVCPMLGWGRTDPKKFWRNARIPGICALVLFALLMVYFFTTLQPAYDATLAKGDSVAQTLAEAGPPIYYTILGVTGMLVASLLFFNGLFILVRTIRSYAESHEVSGLAAIGGMFRTRASQLGGFIAHIAMSVILIGLIGSSMYVTEQTGYMGYDSSTDTATSDFTIQDYTLTYTGSSVDQNTQAGTVTYEVDFDVYKGGSYLGAVHPQVQVAMATQQQKLNASVISLPDEDLFVVYRGVNSQGAFSLDVRVNPLISFVWVGFMLLLIGVLIALVGGRSVKREEEQLKNAGGKRAAKAKEQATTAEPAKVKAQKPAKAKGASVGTTEGSAKASAAPAKAKA